METTVAIRIEKKAMAEARKRYGKDGYVRYSPTAGTKADRDALPKLTPAAIRALPKEDRTRRTAIKCCYRCSVGKVVCKGIFPMFEVKGQGDTWDEAFAKADETDQKEREYYAQFSK